MYEVRRLGLKPRERELAPPILTLPGHWLASEVASAQNDLQKETPDPWLKGEVIPLQAPLAPNCLAAFAPVDLWQTLEQVVPMHTQLSYCIPGAMLRLNPLLM